jgi:hypothetical protein
METISRNKTIPLRPYSLKELAALYDVKPRTVKIWLEQFSTFIGDKKGRFYTIKQIEIIFDKIGEPKELDAA